MKLFEILRGIEYRSSADISFVEISGIVTDSRKVKEGYLFVAIPGIDEEKHGRQFIGDAIKNGAAAILTDEPVFTDIPVITAKPILETLALCCKAFYNDPIKDIKMIGVTGTNGKTTVTNLIRDILSRIKGVKVGLIGTNYIAIGDELKPAENTTPEASELWKIFAEMQKEKCTHIVMEVSSHALALQRVYGISFDVAAFTNLTKDHLDYHGSMESYAHAKSHLFRNSKISAINIDADFHDKMLAAAGETAVTFTLKSDNASYIVKNVHLSAAGVCFEVTNKNITETVKLGIPGEFSVYNALTAYVVCNEISIDRKAVLEGLACSKGVKSRIEIVQTQKTKATVIIDYAHTPDALDNVLKTIRAITTGKIYTLFGCGGNRDKTKRSEMGEIAGTLSDFCIISSDNPRFEKPMDIINDILPGIKKTECPYIMIENRAEAIEYGIKAAGDGDVLLLAGKGHENYIEIEGVKHHFDERELF